jgi:hypothetical protein
MIIAHTLEQYQENNVVLGNREENYNNMYNYYIQLKYFEDFVSLNSLALILPIKNMILLSMYKYTKINFKANNNIELIKNIKTIEESLLMRVDKIPKLSLYSILLKGNIRVPLQECTNKIVILRIYGIWESHDYCGLKYKFMVY